MSFTEGVQGKVYTREYNEDIYSVKVSKDNEGVPYFGRLGAPDSFIREATIMKEVDHPNVMSLVHVSSDFLASQYSIMTKGVSYSLKYFIGLSQMGSEIYPPEKLLLGIARGLYYLEQKNILHGDLDLDSIVVMEDHTPKIINFGLTVIDPVKGLYQHEMTKVGWKSPEELESNFASKDISRGFKTLSWTFGLIVYYIYANSLNVYEDLIGKDYSDLVTEYFKLVGTPPEDDKQFLDLKKALEYAETMYEDEISEFPEYLDKPIKEFELVPDLPTKLLTGDEKADRLIKKCLTWNPDKRISMREILVELGDTPEEELTVFEKLHKNLPADKTYKLPKSFRNYMNEQPDYMENMLAECAFLAAAIYIKSDVESSTIHTTCLCLAAKVLGVDSLHEEIRENVDVLAYTAEEEEVFRRCDYNLHITTSMSYLNVLLEDYDTEDADRLRKKLFKKLLLGEDVLYILPENILM